MRSKIGIIIAAGVIAIAAAAGIACSDDDAPTLEAYFAEVQALADSSDEKATEALGELSDETTGDEFKGKVKNLAAVLEDTSDQFDDIDPADEAKDEHDALGEALDEWASAATDSAKGLDDLDSSTPIDELFNAFNEDGFGETQEAFNNACKALEQVATDNNIEADLNCEDEEDEVAAAEQAIRDAAAAWNAKDAEALAALFTDDGLAASFNGGDPTTREDVVAMLPDIIGEPPLEIQEVSPTLTDDGAETLTVWNLGVVTENIKHSLLLVDGEWKIDNEERQPVDVPAEYETIDVAMSEFAFTFGGSAITSAGGFVLNARNAGAQPHHLLFIKIPDDAVIEELLAADDPPGVEFISGMEPIEPGAEEQVVIGGELEPGRYIFTCFLPDTGDAEGTPHAFKGMVAEFRIE